MLAVFWREDVHFQSRLREDPENDPRSGWPQLLRGPPIGSPCSEKPPAHITGCIGGEAVSLRRTICETRRGLPTDELACGADRTSMARKPSAGRGASIETRRNNAATARS